MTNLKKRKYINQLREEKETLILEKSRLTQKIKDKNILIAVIIEEYEAETGSKVRNLKKSKKAY